MKKYKILIALIGLTVASGISGIGYSKFTSDKTDLYNGLPVAWSNGSYFYDISTPEKAIGVSDYTFVAKINQQLRTEHKYVGTEGLDNGIPYTIYSISVIKNIKGELITSKPIEFMQYGGLELDKKAYQLPVNGELLEVGSYYILMVQTWGGEEGNVIETGIPSNIVKLGTSLDSKNATTLIQNYSAAYENEEIPYVASKKAPLKRVESRFDVKYNK